MYFSSSNPSSLNAWGFYSSLTDAKKPSRRFDSCRVYFSALNPSSLNAWRFYFSLTDAQKPKSQVRFLLGVLFILESLLVECVGILFFSYRCTETQVAGSIPAGCIFSYLDEYPCAGNVRFSCFFKWMQRGPSRRFDSCRVYFSSLNTSSLNAWGFYSSLTDAKKPSRRFDSCRVYFLFTRRLRPPWADMAVSPFAEILCGSTGFQV